MYILFNDDDEVIASADVRRPFTHAVYVDAAQAIVKTIDECDVVHEHSGGDPLYVDKHGVPTTVVAGNSPLINEHPVTRLATITREPLRFTRADVVEHRRRELLASSKFKHCAIIDRNFIDVLCVDVNTSTLVDIGCDDVVVHPTGVAVLALAALDDDLTTAIADGHDFDVVVHADGELKHCERQLTVNQWTIIDRYAGNGSKIIGLINDGRTDVTLDAIYLLW